MPNRSTWILKLLVVSCLMLPVNSFALSPIGLPGPDFNDEEAYQVHIGYFHGTRELEAKDGSNGAEAGQNHLYLETGFLLSENAKVYLRAGVADLDDEKGFSDSWQPWGGIHITGLFSEHRGRSLATGFGYFLQGNIYGNYSASKSVAGGTILKSTLKTPWDMGAGLLYQREFFGNVLFYTGVFGVYGQAKEELSLGTQNVSMDLVEKGNGGVLFGNRAWIGKRFFVETELQWRNNLAYGVKFAYAF